MAGVPALLALGDVPPTIPRPHGWIGTTEAWAQGLGIGFAALDLVILIAAFRTSRTNHCYTCHSDYGMFGTVYAKWEGLGHICRYTTGRYTLPIKINNPYSNLRCLTCHRGSQKFLDPAKHPKEDLPAMLSGKTSCLDCHGPAHPAPATRASR